MPKVYEVGGCVRDSLMGETPKDIDRVVVGATEEFFNVEKFKKVGANFPVFIEIDTGDEWAMARREKKIGEGYMGFACEFGSDVTLEDDLSRRDFTINAIARDAETGEIIDPFSGVSDIQNRIIKAVNPDAFTDDPVRVLRMARFKARYGHEWSISPETQKMINSAGKSGLFNELKPDRIWKEFSRAMMEPFPWLFFEALDECDALKRIFPEIYRMKMTPESLIYHREGNTWEHTKLVIKAVIASQSDCLENRIAALFHDIGKIKTPFEILPAHHGHDKEGAAMMQGTLSKWGVPSRIIEICAWVAEFHMKMHHLDELKPRTIIEMIAPKTRFHLNKHLFQVSEADAEGRISEYKDTESSVRARRLFTDAAEAVTSVRISDIPDISGNVDEMIKNKQYEKIRNASTAHKRHLVKQIMKAAKE